MEFNNLDEIYGYLESNVYNVKRDWELTSAMKKLADKTTDDAIKEKIKWECFVFDFYLQDGKVKPMGSSTKEDGTTIYAYPSYDDFDESGMNYLKFRANQVKSNYLIARYNQILWNGSKPYKHHLQAKNAIDAYLKILDSLNCIKEEKKGGWDCLELMRNAFRLALQVKYKVDSFKTILQSWLFDKRKFPTELKIFVLKFMLDSAQFKKDDFDGSLELVKNIGTVHRKKKPGYFLAKEIYETGLRIAQRSGNDTKIWNKRIGDAIIRMADYRMDDESRMIPLSFLKEAIPYYKLAGLDEKVHEVEHRYFELKKELKLTKYELPLNDEASEALNEYLKVKTGRLMEYTPEEIYAYIISAEDMFPQKKWLVEMGRNRDNAFMDFAVNMRFDINNNVSRQKNTKEAKEKAKIFANYRLYLRLSVLPFLHRIFVDGIEQGKVNYQNLIKFFVNHTWLGQEFTDFDSGGDLIKYRWISLIAPSLHEYFIQTESALRSNSSYTNYILPIDSLTLKFEGVLRDFARILKISTTISGKGNELREKYIEELLAEPEMQKYFDENDQLFFNYLFVAKDGMNLRNNIAHCFYRFNNYNFQIMHLLICAFLRIGKYKMSAQKEK
jgi:Domain of unknown function (DUF4209)